jgi:HemY protein
MIRVILFLVLVGLIALGFAWLADRPGSVAITWLGWRIDTSLTVLAAAVALISATAIVGWSLLRLVLRSPRIIGRARRDRRRERSYRALTKGLVAVGAGDIGAARKFAAEVDRLAPGEPLALLLRAQSAQLSGDRAAAERIFRDMAERSDTRLLGLRGLYVEAQRHEDQVAARHYAEEAAKSATAISWAGRAVLETQLASGDWAGALVSLENNWRGKLIDKQAYRRQRAVLLAAQARALGESERERAAALALEATKLAPGLVPAAVLAGGLLAEAGEVHKAARILETAWKANPHPDIAETYAYLKLGETARARLNRVQALARLAPGHVESAFAVARAALDAREFAVARTALAPLAITPTRRAASLMAEIETLDRGDEGRAREWMARALRAAPDPAWVADGFVSDRWMPVSPVSGRLDAFEWKVPVAAVLAGSGPVIEDSGQTQESPPPIEEASEAALSGEAVLAHSVDAAEAVAAAHARPASMPARRAPERPVDPVIPLVHAPDDPGPEPEPNPAPTVDNRRGLRLFLR